MGTMTTIMKILVGNTITSREVYVTEIYEGIGGGLIVPLDLHSYMDLTHKSISKLM